MPYCCKSWLQSDLVKQPSAGMSLERQSHVTVIKWQQTACWQGGSALGLQEVEFASASTLSSLGGTCLLLHRLMVLSVLQCHQQFANTEPGAGLLP